MASLTLCDKQNPSAEWIEQLRMTYPTDSAVDEALTRKMRRRSGPPHKRLRLADVEAALIEFLTPRYPFPISVSNVASLAGGSSKEQFSFVLSYGTLSERGGKKHVVRFDPSESIIQTSRLREFEVLRAVHGHVPTPNVLWVDDTGESLGRPAIIMEYCDGITRPPISGAHNLRQGFGRDLRDVLAPQFIDHLAAIARFDWRKAEISTFDSPQDGTVEPVLRELSHWERVWQEDAVEPYPLMTYAADWLRKNAPPVDRISIVHGDYRGGNFLYDQQTSQITAILDWELSHLGDRHEDLALLLNPMLGEKAENGALLLGGFAAKEPFLERYAASTGLPVDLPRLGYYEIFVSYRSVNTALATATRCALGQKTHQDARVLWAGCSAYSSLNCLRDALERYA